MFLDHIAKIREEGKTPGTIDEYCMLDMIDGVPLEVHGSVHIR